jgi:carboxypeptidase Taq
MSNSATEAFEELLKRSREYRLLASTAELLGWDERTYMPRQGSAHRGGQMGILARLCHEILTHPRTGELLGQAESSGLTSNRESDSAVNLREIRRTYDRAVKVPQRLVEEIARVTIQAQGVWQEARQANDFRPFRPWLEKVVALKREEAAAVGYKGVPYDALLDEYEPGATTAEITKVFAALRAELVPLVAAIADSGRCPRCDILEREYPVLRQEEFSQKAAAAIGFDFKSGRLDKTTHPFCSGIGPGDCRLTTRYNPRHFNDAFFSVLHEAGHGIYEQGLDPAHYGTPLGSIVSLGIHESQSRMWENQVGRSGPFWEHFFPAAKEAFAGALTNESVEDFVFAVNDVRPSFIRVEADEATYNLHIIVRFELEQDLISGNLKPADVPGAWNEKFQQVLGLMPPTPALGCLQDVHWSSGGIGYFPTYTLGNMYAAQFMARARQELGNLDADFRRGDFAGLKGWLNEKIHKVGMRYRAGELCQRVTGQPLSHVPLIKYLREKYRALYGIAS